MEASRRSFNKDFLLALTADFKKHGASAIEKVRKQQPAAYMKICALLVPREMRVEHSSGVKAMTDEQLEAGIAAIEAMLARRAGDDAKVIEAGKSSPEKLATSEPSHHAQGVADHGRRYGQGAGGDGLASVINCVWRMMLRPRRRRQGAAARPTPTPRQPPTPRLARNFFIKAASPYAAYFFVFGP